VARVVEVALASYLKIHRRLASSPLGRRQRNASYFSSLEMHERMLADTRRIESYYQAIAKYVKEGDVVLDLGTGTGILSFFASAQRPKKVYAIDHSNIIKCALALADSNGISGIEFVRKHSKSFEPKEKVDVIIQEQMGSWLFNENMVDSVLDLRNRVLKKGGRILPNRFEVYFEPAQLKRQSVVPLIWENRIHDVGFSCIRESREDHGVAPLMLQPHDVDLLLAESEPVVTFDLEAMGDSGEITRRWQYSKPATVSGRFDGFVFYFKAFFDDDIVLDTAPAPPHECPAQRRLPFYRAPRAPIEEGDRISLDLRLGDLHDHSSWSWSYSLEPGSSSAGRVATT
jgi:type I protein arginine methyltransferase